MYLKVVETYCPYCFKLAERVKVNGSFPSYFVGLNCANCGKKEKIEEKVVQKYN